MRYESQLQPIMTGDYLVLPVRRRADSVSAFGGVLPGLGWRGRFPDQMQLPPVQKFPGHLFPRFQPNGRRQGERKINVEFGGLPFGPDGLHLQ